MSRRSPVAPLRPRTAALSDLPAAPNAVPDALRDIRRIGSRAAALLLGAATALSACRSSPPLLPDASTGRWVNPMGVALDLAPTGIFTLEVPGKPVAVGRVAVLEGEGTFRFQYGSSFCPEEPGVYRVGADDGTLQLTLVRDTCPERTEAFERPFARPGR